MNATTLIRTGSLVAVLALLVWSSSEAAARGPRGSRHGSGGSVHASIGHGYGHGHSYGYGRFYGGPQAYRPHPGHPLLVKPFPEHPWVVHPPVGHHRPPRYHRPPYRHHGYHRMSRGVEIAHGILQIVDGATRHH